MKHIRSRDPALDILRCFALFCVISVHFFLNTGYYDLPLTGGKLYFMTLLRSGFMICVPLFLMLSGYVMGNRMPTRKYYSKIGKTLFLYASASICCGAYQAYAAKVYWNQPIPLWDLVLGVFSFTTAPYAWYIEMYLILFLLIPYLNILYQNIPTKRAKQGLLLILLLATALPGVTNVHCLTDVNWWADPSSSSYYNGILPDWWTQLYPISYYYLGCYLREYPLKRKLPANLLWITAAWLIGGSFNFYRSHSVPFVNGAWNEHGSLLTVALAVPVFHLIASTDCSKLSKLPRTVLAYCSDWCLGAYLVSWIFDQHFYSSLRDEVPEVMDRFRYFLPMVTKVFLCSLALSAGLNLLYRVFAKSAALLRHRSEV